MEVALQQYLDPSALGATSGGGGRKINVAVFGMKPRNSHMAYVLPL